MPRRCVVPYCNTGRKADNAKHSRKTYRHILRAFYNKMAENRLPSHCLMGFREDCAKLIDRFGKLETVRFQGFADIWKDMKFSLIFSGRKSLIEQIEFCEDSLVVAKEFFSPPLSFKERIGGLYLLYSLYFKMPLKGPKIRVKIEDWQDIVEIRAEIVQAEHHDASYILSKLMFENAFVHCSLEQEFALEKSYRLKGPKLRNTYSVLSDIRELAGPGDLLNRVNVFGEHYRLIKACEMENRSTTDLRRTIRSSECLKLYDSSFGKHLLDAVEQLENSRKFIKFAKLRGLPSPDDSSTHDTQPEVRKDRSKKSRTVGSNPIRNHLGHGFDTDSSVSESEEFTNETVRNDMPDHIFHDSPVSD